MVDWRVARMIATGVAGAPEARPLAGDLAELCADGERRVVAYTGMTPAATLPAPEAVDRAAWVDANLGSMRGVIEPLTGRLLGEDEGGPGGFLRGAARSAGGLAMAVEVGALVGLMGQRVLGQYDVPPLDPDGPARLLLVAPNVHEAAGRLAVDEASLLRWVVLHEVTHAVQFSAVPGYAATSPACCASCSTRSMCRWTCAPPPVWWSTASSSTRWSRGCARVGWSPRPSAPGAARCWTAYRRRWR